jgi:hypothetical protein
MKLIRFDKTSSYFVRNYDAELYMTQSGLKEYVIVQEERCGFQESVYYPLEVCQNLEPCVLHASIKYTVCGQKAVNRCSGSNYGPLENPECGRALCMEHRYCTKHQVYGS